MLIPFTVTIAEAERDRSLASKLKKESSGILTWAVKGCLEYQRIGLAPPQQVLVATKNYREEMDVLGDFLAATCIKKAGAETRARDLYQAYRSWCERTGEEPLNQRNFGMRLTERGFRRRKSGGAYLYTDIGLLVSDTTVDDRLRDEEG